MHIEEGRRLGGYLVDLCNFIADLKVAAMKMVMGLGSSQGRIVHSYVVGWLVNVQ